MPRKMAQEIIAKVRQVDWQSWFSGPKLQIVQVVVALVALIVLVGYGKALTWPAVTLS